MKGRTAIAGTALNARLTAAGLGTLTILVSGAVVGCSGSGSSTPTVFSPSVSGSPVPSPSPSPSPSGTTTTNTAPTATPTSTVTVVPTNTVTQTTTPVPTVTATHTVFPTTAPRTGGGGTAGLQDGLLFGLGGAAMLAGAGGVVYRRRLNKHR